MLRMKVGGECSYIYFGFMRLLDLLSGYKIAAGQTSFHLAFAITIITLPKE